MTVSGKIEGKIIKGIAGFYYVWVEGCGSYECKARGIFRNQGVKPLVGDNVELEILDETEKEGNIVRLLERKNELVRPALANVDQAMIIFSLTEPKPNLQLLDRFLLMMNRREIPALICFNKTDIASTGEMGRLKSIYRGSGCEILFISAKECVGIDEVRQALKGHVTTVAGPSGVGKSTLINLLAPDAGIKTGSVSEKIGRGKHTTRHSELFWIGENSFIFDTPGFSSLDVERMEKEELASCFPEFFPYIGKCRFLSCLHENEPDCAVKEAVAEGLISRERYGSYLYFLGELKERERRRYS